MQSLQSSMLAMLLCLLVALSGTPGCWSSSSDSDATDEAQASDTMKYSATVQWGVPGGGGGSGSGTPGSSVNRCPEFV